MNKEFFLIINSLAGRFNWLDQFMIFSAEWLGYFLVLFLFVPFLATFFIKGERLSAWLRRALLEFSYYKKMIFLAFGSAIVSRFVFVELIRFFYYHPRPFAVINNVNQLINHETTSSFPSGHATFYFALATGVYLYNKKAGWLYLALAGLVSFARVFSGVHWPLDILAGALLGVFTAVTITKLHKLR